MTNILIGAKAPDFTAKAVVPNKQINESFNFHSYIKNKYAVVFFYPLDFTFVCPSEIIAFNNNIGEFAKRNAVVIGVSVDSHFTHLAWMNTPVNKGGIGSLQFPLVSDLSKNIARDYGVLIGDVVALRGTFIMDKTATIRHLSVNDLPLGRSVEETLRLLDAWIHHEKHGEVCPAGWRPGKEAMKPSSDGVADYLASNADKL